MWIVNCSDGRQKAYFGPHQTDSFFSHLKSLRDKKRHFTLRRASSSSETMENDVHLYLQKYDAEKCVATKHLPPRC